MKKSLYLLFALSVLTQCRPDVVEDFVPLGSQESAILGLLQQAVDPTAETTLSLSFPLDDTIQMTSQSGSKVIILDPEAALVDDQGLTVPCSSCAELKIILKEVVSYRQIVANGLTLLPTTGDVSKTTGALFVEIYCNGKLLQPAAGSDIEVELVNYDARINLVQQYTAMLDQDNRFVGWEINPGHFIYDFFRTNTPYEGYEFKIKKFGWNVGFIPLQAPTGTFCLDMDPKYNSETAFAYLILGTERTGIRIPFDVQRGQFCLEGVPQGLDAKVFVISKQGDTWQTVQSDVNTSAGQLTINPLKATEQEVIQQVKDL